MSKIHILTYDWLFSTRKREGLKPALKNVNVHQLAGICRLNPEFPEMMAGQPFQVSEEHGIYE